MSVANVKTQPPARALILSRFAPYRIVALGHAMGDRLARAYADESVSINEWRVLAVIAQSETIAARDVVRLTPMDKMTVSRTVAGLETKGLAERSVDARDRRVNMLALTQEGRALYARIALLALDYEEEILSALTVDDRENLDRILSILTKTTGAAGCDSSAR